MMKKVLCILVSMSFLLTGVVTDARASALLHKSTLAPRVFHDSSGATLAQAPVKPIAKALALIDEASSTIEKEVNKATNLSWKEAEKTLRNCSVILIDIFPLELPDIHRSRITFFIDQSFKLYSNNNKGSFQNPKDFLEALQERLEIIAKQTLIDAISEIYSSKGAVDKITLTLAEISEATGIPVEKLKNLIFKDETNTVVRLLMVSYRDIGSVESFPDSDKIVIARRGSEETQSSASDSKAGKGTAAPAAGEAERVVKVPRNDERDGGVPDSTRPAEEVNGDDKVDTAATCGGDVNLAALKNARRLWKKIVPARAEGKVKDGEEVFVLKRESIIMSAKTTPIGTYLRALDLKNKLRDILQLLLEEGVLISDPSGLIEERIYRLATTDEVGGRLRAHTPALADQLPAAQEAAQVATFPEDKLRFVVIGNSAVRIGSEDRDSKVEMLSIEEVAKNIGIEAQAINPFSFDDYETVVKVGTDKIAAAVKRKNDEQVIVILAQPPPQFYSSGLGDIVLIDNNKAAGEAVTAILAENKNAIVYRADNPLYKTGKALYNMAISFAPLAVLGRVDAEIASLYDRPDVESARLNPLLDKAGKLRQAMGINVPIGFDPHAFLRGEPEAKKRQILLLPPVPTITVSGDVWDVLAAFRLFGRML